MRTLRLRPRHQDDIRAKIQVSQLLNIVQNYAATGRMPRGKKAVGTASTKQGGVLVDPQEAGQRLRAALALIAKRVPDLSSIELTGVPDRPLHIFNQTDFAKLSDTELGVLLKAYEKLGINRALLEPPGTEAAPLEGAQR